MAVSKHQHLLFFRFRLEKYNFLRKKKYFYWLNSAFPFILSVILYLWIRIRIRNPDPDPDPRTQMNPDPTGSGSTSLVKFLCAVSIQFLVSCWVDRRGGRKHLWPSLSCVYVHLPLPCTVYTNVKDKKNKTTFDIFTSLTNSSAHLKSSFYWWTVYTSCLQ